MEWLSGPKQQPAKLSNHGFKSRLHLQQQNEFVELKWSIGAAVAHFLDMEGVTGSIPVSTTIFLEPETTHWLERQLAGSIPVSTTKKSSQVGSFFYLFSFRVFAVAARLAAALCGSLESLVP